MKALVIEDDEHTLTFFVDALNDAGYDAIGASSGAEAREEFGRDHYGLVTLDLGLPDEDGLQFCKWLRQQPGGAEAYVMVITGRSEPEEITAVLEAGASDYIAKPLSLPALLVRLAVAADKIRSSESQKILVGEAPPAPPPSPDMAHPKQTEGRGGEDGFSDRALKALLSLTSDCILILDKHNKIIQASLAAEHRLKAEAGALVQKAVTEFIPLLGTAADPGAGRRSAEARDTKGEVFPISLRTKRVGGPKGNVTILVFE